MVEAKAAAINIIQAYYMATIIDQIHTAKFREKLVSTTQNSMELCMEDLNVLLRVGFFINFKHKKFIIHFNFLGYDITATNCCGKYNEQYCCTNEEKMQSSMQYSKDTFYDSTYNQERNTKENNLFFIICIALIIALLIGLVVLLYFCHTKQFYKQVPLARQNETKPLIFKLNFSFSLIKENN